MQGGPAPRQRTRPRRAGVALGLSLLLHGLALLWAVASLRPPPPPPPRTIPFTWLELPPSPPPPPPSHPPRPPGLPAPTAPGPRARPPAPAPSAAAAPAPRPAAPPADRPTVLDLSPRLAGPGPLPTGEGPAGRTLRPGDLPDERERLADAQAQGTARVEAWVGGALAAARVRGGLPDPAYGELGSQLRQATREVPRFIDLDKPGEVVGAVLQSWSAGAARYGQTGAAYAEPEGRREALELPSALGEAAARGSPQGQELAAWLYAGARLQEFADGRAGAELYALVELRQQAGGALDSVRLLRASGLAPFDAWVSERARQVGQGFSLDAGARSRPLRSVWRFDGAIVYRQKVDLARLDTPEALALAGKTALSVLGGLMGGRFDETTGNLDVIDFTRPSYTCKVTLLEAD